VAATFGASGKPVRLLLVDDSDVYRSTMELLLGREPGLEVVGTAADSDTALRVCRELDVDLVLLDYRLPDADGTGVTSVLAREHPDVTVVCLTAEASSDERARVLRAGAAAVVEKGDLEALLCTIREVAGGS
jgi:DNA-binding NarL/FixJ family response regulator